jgi:hypothetical protein
MTTTSLIEFLTTLDPEARLNDGATTWTAENLIDALNDAEEIEYDLGFDSEGRIMITRIKDDGYLESVPSFRGE